MRSVVYNPPEEICDYFQLHPKKHNSCLCLDFWRSCEKNKLRFLQFILFLDVNNGFKE